MIIFAILFTLACSLNAQTYKFMAHSFAYKLYENNRWTEWSEWEESRLLIVISLDRRVINIYSEKMQEYDIIDYIGKEEDNDGGTSIKYKCVDQDGLRCHIRLRALSDGSAQLYVDFNDLMFVYGMEKRE